MAVSIGDPGVSLAAARGWMLVSTRRKRKPKGTGDAGVSGAPKVNVEKHLRFSNYAEVYDITAQRP